MSNAFLDDLQATCRPPGIDRWTLAIVAQVSAMLAGRACVHRGHFKAGDGSYSPGERGYVYVVQAGEGGLVKIGRAADPADRLRDIQASCPVPLRLLALSRGTCNLESHWHRRFWKQRVHCEWFEPSVGKIFEDATAQAGADGCARCVIEGDRFIGPQRGER